MVKKEKYPHKRPDLQGRRKLLKILGLSAAGLVLTSVGVFALQEIQKPNTAEERLLHAINDLPPTPLKTILQQQVSPLFTSARPTSLDLGPIKIPFIKSAVVEQHHNIYAARGTVFNYPDLDLIPSFTVLNDTILTVPYPYLTTDEYKSHRSFVDGTPVINIGARKGTKVHSGIAPEIRIVRPFTAIVAPENVEKYDALTNIVRVKEAATLFYNLQWMRKIAEFMQQAGLPININTIDDLGNGQDTQAMTFIDMTFNRIRGRSGVMLDTSGLIFALKAYEDTQVLEYAKQSDRNPNSYIDQLSDVYLGTTSDEVFTNTFNYIVNNSHGEQGLYYNPVFDFNTIP